MISRNDNKFERCSRNENWKEMKKRERKKNRKSKKKMKKEKEQEQKKSERENTRKENAVWSNDQKDYTLCPK